MFALIKRNQINITAIVCSLFLFVGASTLAYSHGGGHGGGHRGGGHHGGYHGGGHHGAWGHGGYHRGGYYRGGYHSGWRSGGWGYGGYNYRGGVVGVRSSGCIWIPKHRNRNGYVVRGQWAC